VGESAGLVVALTRVNIWSPNYSSRGGATVRLIVLHDTEGSLTYQSLGAWFANPASQVSSHVGIDNARAGIIGQYVTRDTKAWTAGNANPVGIQAELCAPSGAAATWTRADWLARPIMLANTSAWIAEEAAYFKIPIVRLTPSQAQTNGRGVCMHSDLGAWGGGHHDCGPGFPIDQVIAAAGGPPTPPTPTPTPTEVRMFLARSTSDSSHDPTIRTGLTYVIKDCGIAPVATGADGAALQKILGPFVDLTGNQIWGFK
jgi:hypothetical protein